MNKEEIKQLLEYNPETGIFTWKNPLSNRVKAGDVAGNIDVQSGYLQLRINGKKQYGHRIAFLFMENEIPKMVDHINGNRSDNRFSNLRKVNARQNVLNSSRRSDNTSGIKGVIWDSRSSKWVVRLTIDGKEKQFGMYEDVTEAAEKLVKVIKEKRGDFACLRGSSKQFDKLLDKWQ